MLEEQMYHVIYNGLEKIFWYVLEAFVRGIGDIEVVETNV